MTESESPVGESLGEVRKSFRVLHEYNKFVTDLISYLAENIHDIGFYQWGPAYTDTPPVRSSSPLNRNSWEFLPFYDLSVLFLTEGANTEPCNGDTMLEINVSADSAFLEADDNQGLPSEDPVNESVSTIGIYLWLSNTEHESNWLKEIWNPCPEYPPDKGVYKHPHTDVTITGTFDNLENVADREGADALLRKFRFAVQTNLGDILP